MAVITGSARRLGKSLAIGLASKGFHIAIHYNNSEKEAKETQQEIQQEMDQNFSSPQGSARLLCHIFSADLTNVAQTESLLARVIEKFGRLDVLVNSASQYHPGKLLSSAPTPAHSESQKKCRRHSEGEQWYQELEQMFRVNVFSPLILMRKMAASIESGLPAKTHVAKTHKTHVAKTLSANYLIINILDNKIFYEQYDYFNYVLSKKALAAATTMAAMELAPSIRVNGICPGVILPAADRSAAYLSYRKQGIPLLAMGSPEHILAAVFYLLENKFVTGELLTVDGGEAKSAGGFGQGRNYMSYPYHTPDATTDATSEPNA